MQVNRCIGCMEETASYPCPHCGYQPAAQKNDFMLKPNTILCGQYLLGRMLGQGGFGITYIGWDLAAESKVAIKEFYPFGHATRAKHDPVEVEWSESPETQELKESGIQSFRREASKMAKLDDVPEIVPVRRVFQENNTAYIVMDYIAGETLKDTVNKNGPMDWARARKIFLPAIQAMERVHREGLIHRDISPDNLMLEPDGRVKILDLGAAKDLNINSGASSMLVAKGGFSPLEQYVSRGQSGPWTDVYAMGATIYFALTGVNPPSSMERSDKDTIDWSQPAFSGMPEHVVNALRKAMSISKEDRFQSMQAFLEALLTMQKNRAPAAGKPPVPPMPPQPMMHAAPAAPAAPASPAEHKRAGKPPRPPKKKRSPLPLILFVLVLAAVGFLLWTNRSCLTGHSWEPATCRAPETCSVCHRTRGKTVEHTYVDATCAQAKHCIYCEEEIGQPLAHQTSGSATCTEDLLCSVCGDVVTPALGHDFSGGVCTRCGEKDLQNSVSGHWSDSKQILNADGAEAYIFELNSPLQRCREATFQFTLVQSVGTFQNDWCLVYRDSNTSEWKLLKEFTLDSDQTKRKETQSFALTFDPSISLDAISAYPVQGGSSIKWSMTLGIIGVVTN